MKDETFKLPRLYVETALKDQTLIALDAGQAHYLYNVLRRRDGNTVRLFDGHNGEWLGRLEGLNKKNGSVALIEQFCPQPVSPRRIHLFFTPIKKNRMDWLIEKAVELGVSEFHPILTQNTEVRKINTDRLKQQIFEAAEQCERFEIPALHALEKLETKLSIWPQDMAVLSCLERYDAKPIQDVAKETDHDIAFLIGPEGGFTTEEKNNIATQTTPVTLGETILRCETAVVKALVLIQG